MKKIFIIVFVIMLLMNVSVYAEPSKLDIENGYKYYVILAYNSGPKVQYYIEAQYPFTVDVNFQDITFIRSYIKENGESVYSEDLYIYKSTDNGANWNFHKVAEYSYFKLAPDSDDFNPLSPCGERLR